MRLFPSLAVRTGRGFGKARKKLFRTCADLPPVSRYLDRRRSEDMAAFAAYLPHLSPFDHAVVQRLRETGYAVTTVADFDLPEHQMLLRDGAHVGRAFAAVAKAQARIGVQHNAVSGDVITAHPQLYRWGLHARLLDIAETYLQCTTAYEGGLVSYTVADGAQQGPRRWHVDYEDRRMIKVIIYCNDVGAEDGPFELVTDTVGAVSETVTITGQAGTLIFVDTARLRHRGRPATASDRIALFAHYFPRRPRYRLGFPQAAVTGRQVRTLASGLPPRSQAAAFWREAARRRKVSA